MEIQHMIEGKNDGEAEWFYVQCPFSEITECVRPMIIKGYCMLGMYCIENCSYAWISARDDA